MNPKDENDNYYGPCSDIVNRATRNVGVDVFVRCEGTIFLFTPISPRAKQWICMNVQPNARWFGSALVVEHRYAAELAAGMRDAGLVLA